MKTLTYFAIFYVTIIHASSLKDSDADPVILEDLSDDGKIVNGLEAQLCQFPYQVSILEVSATNASDLNHFCGGSLIRNNAVLTSARCVFGKRTRNLKVLVGTKFLSDKFNPNFVYDVAAFVRHDAYDTTTFANDIAIIFLADSVVPNTCTIQTVALATAAADTTIPDGEALVPSGWGYLFEGANFYPNQLKYVQVPLVPIARCTAQYAATPTPVATAFHICGGYSYGGQDFCTGDNGGPLIRVSNGNLVGISSFNNGCARPMYTKVVNYLTWINAQAPIG